MKLLLAFNPFRGTMSAAEATQAVARGLRRAQPRWRLDRLAAADGGPATLAALRGQGRLRHASVNGPLGRVVRAAWLDLGRDALIESAQAIGLGLLRADQRDALRAHSLGLGQLLLAVAKAGKRHVYLGLGGSACTDGGLGLALALGWRAEDASGRPLPLGGGSLRRLARLRPPLRSPLGRLKVTVLCDVDAPLFGSKGAARVYAPQKGATPAQVRALDTGLRRLARLHRPALARRPGAGAAGGVGYGLQAFAGATLQPGAATLLHLAGFEARLRACDAVLSGEGSLDAQSLQGKLPVVVAKAARRAKKPCILFCGRSKLSFRLAKVIEAPGGAAELEAAAFQWAQGK